ncbi:uncharacterized protein LOC120342536 [Styela clava]
MLNVVFRLSVIFYLIVFSKSHSIENSDLCQNLNTFCSSAKQQCGSSSTDSHFNRVVGVPGKRGPKGSSGPNGPIGPQGPPGVVDYETIQGLIDSRLSVLNEMEERIDFMNKSIIKLSEFHEKVSVEDCDVYYRGKCFKIPEDLHNSQDVDFAQAEQMCRNIGWKLANIYSLEHYQSVAAYLRTKIPSSNFATVWLGMTRNQQTQTVYLSDGTVAPPLPWYPSYPSSASTRTKMNIDINSNEKSLSQGMVNYSSTGGRRGALCQI